MSDPDLLNAIVRLTAELERFNNALYSIGTDQLLVSSVDLASPQSVDDWSATVAQMQLTRDPYPAAAPDLATDLAEELESLRYLIMQITGGAQWYIDPVSNITNIWNMVSPLNTVYTNHVNNIVATPNRTLIFNTACRTITIRTNVGNVGNVNVGDVTVDATNGYIMGAGEVLSLDVDCSIDPLYGSSDNGTEDVSYIALN